MDHTLESGRPGQGDVPCASMNLSLYQHRIGRMRDNAAKHGTRIALVSLYDVENNAVRLLAATLRRRGHHVVEIYFKDWISNHLDPATDADLAAAVGVMSEQEVQVVGLSLRASAYLQTARLLTETIHAELEIPVLWGGMHPTLMGDGCMRDADFVLQGEGERALETFADALAHGGDAMETPNLCSRSDGQLRKNALGPLIEDLDQLAYRDYETHQQKYFIWKGRVHHGDPMHGDPVFQMMGSRGCIYKCSFCYNSTFKSKVYPGQKWYRVRSVDSIIDEIRYAQSHWAFKRLRFDDEVFYFRDGWVEEFCKKYPREIGLPFEIFIEPKLVDPHRFELLRDAGLTGVNMGIQSSERVTGHLYDRRVKNHAISDIAELLNKLGIRPHFQLIFDDPVSTTEDKRRLFEMVADFPRPYDLYLFSMTVFPSSELDQKLMDTGVISEWDIEGTNTRTFYQHRINLRYPRPVEDTFWIALCVLLSKGFVPRSTLRRLSKSEFLKRHPWPLIQLAQGANYAKMGGIAAKMAVDGEMTRTLMRRWMSFDRSITT